jgi:hypothetical protein
VVEVAAADDLPIQTDGPQVGGSGYVVVDDVIDLECAGGGAAQQHVGRAATAEIAEPDELIIGSDATQGVPRQDRSISNVVDFIEAVRTVAQDHVASGAGRWGRVWFLRRIGNEPMERPEVAVLSIGADDLPKVVDMAYVGGSAQGIVDRGEAAVAVKEAVMMALAINVRPGDLARVVDTVQKGESGGLRMVDRGVSAPAVEEPVISALVIYIKSNNLTRVVNGIRPCVYRKPYPY